MAIVTRSGKGSQLTHAELDNNFVELRDGTNLAVPKTKNATGIKIGPVTNQTYGWHDLTGQLQVYGDVGDASRLVYRGGIKALEFNEGESAYVDFHMPHDYLPGSDIFIHVHWSHTSTLVTGGSATWGFEVMYAKGHNQAAFHAPVLISVVQNASTTQYQHMIAETVGSTAGGSLVLLDTNDLEVDGVMQCRLYLDSNDLTVSSGPQPNLFAHFVDIHYQSTNVATKNRAPDFWA